MILKSGKYKGKNFHDTPRNYQNWLLIQKWFKPETMKPQELSVGNWVNFEGSPIKIGFVSEKFVCYYTDAKDISIAIEHLEPIPLTPEILKKAGFVVIGNFEYFDFALTEFELDIDSLVPLSLSYNNIQTKHLHTLQNLYLIATGTELNIEL